MFIKYFPVFIVLVFFISCTTADKRNEVEDNTEKTEEPSLEKEKESVSEKIILRDYYNDKKYTLAELSMKKPVFMEVSATWCEPCKDLSELTEKLKTYYGTSVFFIRVYLPGDKLPENDENDIIRMEIIDSPDELSIETNEIFPRAIIISRDGKRIEAVLDGIFPILIYHGVLSGL